VRKTIRQFAPVVVNNETGSDIKTVKMVISNVILKVKVYQQTTCPLRIETKDLKQLTLLLILGVQAELNPGPKTKYPCQVCNKAVKWGQRGTACDNCDLWYHQACMSMNTDSYQHLANSSIAWIFLSHYFFTH
jgi:hypothetical protein